MDETTKASIDRISVRYDPPEQISSGQTVSVFYDCYQLTPSELARLAADAIGDLAHDAFDIAVGLAYSGILYAAAVAGGRQVSIVQKNGQLFGPNVQGKRVIIVDDVAHSGGHLLKGAEIVRAQGGEIVGYVCIVDRSSGKLTDQDSVLGAPLWSAFQADME